MGVYTISKNSSLDVDLSADYQDNGWSFVNGNAVHSSVNEGSIRIPIISTIPGETYNVGFTVSGLNGSVIITLGGESEEITENGEYTLSMTAQDTSGLYVFSDSDVVVGPVKITRDEIPYSTMYYNPKGLLDSYMSFTTEGMVNLLGGFYSFKNGQLWKHNENATVNSFHGVTYESIITFLINVEPKIVKNLGTMKINGNRRWDMVEVFVKPYDGKPRGQKSRLANNVFESLQGDFHAAFLKDMSDPRFNNEIQALFEGADLQGKIIEVTMRVQGGEEIRLVTADFTYSNSNYTY